MRKNIIVDTDSYKRVHWKMVNPGLTLLSSYGEPRTGGRYPSVSYFGIRMIVKDHFLKPVTNEMIEEAEYRSIRTFGHANYFNRSVWEKVRDLGFLPIQIKAAPEGSEIPEGNVCHIITSTKDWFASTVNSLESLLMHVWYPTAVATRSMYIKRKLKPIFDKTSDIGDIVLPVAVNDFGLRGTTSMESAARGGAGHLVHFIGSDNEPAMTALQDYYGCNDRLKSVWATEHSVALSFGTNPEDEMSYFVHQLAQSPSDAIISVVIDTKDSDNFVQNIVGAEYIKKLILSRTGRLVLRPDSGNPLINILKYLDILGGIFGYHINTKGYKVISANVGLLQGDGMDENSIVDLYQEVTKAGWAADNFITGSGGGLLQEDLTRDTSRWAIKPSYGYFGETYKEMQKIPKTDPSKASKGGELKLHSSMNSFTTLSSSNMTKAQFEGYTDALEVVLEDGYFYEENFKNIVERAKKTTYE